jgi:hypothetical protein
MRPNSKTTPANLIPTAADCPEDCPEVGVGGDAEQAEAQGGVGQAGDCQGEAVADEAAPAGEQRGQGGAEGQEGEAGQEGEGQEF